MAGANVHAVNDLNFDTEVLQADAPVLVDFSAVWCGPCKQIAPLIDQLADEYVDKVKVTHLDIDESPGIASKYGIRGVPTLMVFKGGELVAFTVSISTRTTGATTSCAIRSPDSIVKASLPWLIRSTWTSPR